MKSVLISIQPSNTCNIFDGFKDIEWRTRPLPTGKYYCYETKNGGGIGKVIGEFYIAHTKRFEDIGDIPEAFIKLGCVSRKFLCKYRKDRPLYANFIIQRKRYDKPRELREFITPTDCNSTIAKDMLCNTCCLSAKFCSKKSKRITRPPQSWCYVEEVGEGNAGERQ